MRNISMKERECKRLVETQIIYGIINTKPEKNPK